MARGYVTGWFSPLHVDVMAWFYRVEDCCGEVRFEAEVMRSGTLAERSFDTDLSRLQSRVLARYGGLPRRKLPTRPPGPPARG